MKIKKFLVLLIILVLTISLGLTAFAKPISFEIKRSQGARCIADNTKDLTGSQWQISNMNTAKSDFVAGYDVIGFRTRNPSGSALSDYHTFSKFVYRYSLPYTSTPAKGAALKLHTQIDSKGYFDFINFDGEWIS